MWAPINTKMSEKLIRGQSSLCEKFTSSAAPSAHAPVPVWTWTEQHTDHGTSHPQVLSFSKQSCSCWLPSISPPTPAPQKTTVHLRKHGASLIHLTIPQNTALGIYNIFVKYTISVTGLPRSHRQGGNAHHLQCLVKRRTSSTRGGCCSWQCHA